MNQEAAYAKIEAHFRANKDRFTKRFSRYFSSKERGEDTVSQAYTNMLAYWNTAPEDDEHFEKWTRTVLNNAGKKNHKEEMLHGATNSTDDGEEPAAPPITIPRIIVNEVAKLIETKSEPEKTVLRLSLIEGWKPSDIQDVVDYKLSTIKNMTFNFRKEIKEQFKWSV